MEKAKMKKIILEAHWEIVIRTLGVVSRLKYVAISSFISKWAISSSFGSTIVTSYSRVFSIVRGTSLAGARSPKASRFLRLSSWRLRFALKIPVQSIERNKFNSTR
uniref:Uncharacterized protein n=1 Tax=Romanomermis culicivorax TaxID=13658 RepID=A0A915J1C8_ROMCU